MKNKLMLILGLMVILTTFVSLNVGGEDDPVTSGHPFIPDGLTEEQKETLPMDKFNEVSMEEERQPIMDGTPMTFRDDDGKAFWTGTMEEYHTLIAENPLFVNEMYDAYEKGPEVLEEKIKEVENLLDEKLGEDREELNKEVEDMLPLDLEN